MPERDERDGPIAERLRVLAEEVTRLRTRVDALERAAEAPTARRSSTAGAAEATAAEAPAAEMPHNFLANAGRSFLVLAGAFLLRALTDSGVLPAVLGVVAALVYAAALLLLARRDARRDEVESATFHALVAALIAFPVLVEASNKLDVFSPPASALALTATVLLGITVAVTGGLRLTAWAFALGGAATGLILRITTGAEAVFIAPVLVIGFLSLWMARARGWSGPRWPVAAAANLAVLELVVAATRASGGEAPTTASPVAALAITTGLVLVYVGSIGIRTVVRRHDVELFEILQSCLALAIGVLGAWLVFRTTEFPALVLGLPLSVLAAACYAIAFAFIRRRQGRGRNFFFYSTLGGLLTLVALPLLLEGGAVPIAFGGLAVVGAFLGGRLDRITLRAHAAVFAVVALGLSGYPGFVLGAFFGDGLGHASTVLAVCVGLCLLGYVVLLRTEACAGMSATRRLPRFVLGALGLAGLVSQIVVWATGAFAGGGPSAHAALATIAISGVAIGVAGAGRRLAFRELAWLTYPLLLAGAAKLVLTDLQVGNAGTLFLGFACYGAGLIVAPRLLRGGRDESSHA